MSWLFSLRSVQFALDYFFSPQAILSNWRKPMDQRLTVFVTLVIFFLMNFWMSIVCMTLPVPAGSFIPVFVLGACLGRITGEAMAVWFPEGLDPDHGHLIIPGGMD